MKYKEICHEWDVWHGGKNLGKKLVKVGYKLYTKTILIYNHGNININGLFKTVKIFQTYPTRLVKKKDLLLG